MSTPQSAKYLSLDVLRGFAIIAVFFVHLNGATFWGVSIPWSGVWKNFRGVPASAVAFYPFSLGYLGVALFFVLSGYCIHLSFLAYLKKQDGNFAFRHFFAYFFVRRFFRIYPVYFLAVLFFALVYQREHYEGTALLAQILSHLLMVQNFSATTYNAVNESFWSLAYEWQLYVLFPFFLLLRQKIGFQRALGTVVFLSLVYTLFSTASHSDLEVWKDAVFRSRYIFPWFFGVYLCEQHSAGKKVFPESTPALIAAFAVGLALTQLRIFRNLHWELFTPLFGWTVEAYLGRKQLNLFEQIFAGIGVISYSLYLLHGPLLEYGLAHLHKFFLHGYPYNQLTVGGIGLILVPLIILSALSYRLIERPFHEFGQRWSKNFLPAAAVPRKSYASAKDASASLSLH